MVKMAILRAEYGVIAGFIESTKPDIVSINHQLSFAREGSKFEKNKKLPMMVPKQFLLV